jgi:outer membrane protein insertion porin family
MSASCLLSSCVGTSYLQKNEYLLTEQYTVGNKKVKTADLEPYYLQDSNRKLLGLPIWLWIYDVGRRYFNRSAIEQSYQRVAAHYDEQLVAAVHQPKKWERLQKAKKKKLASYEQLLQKGNFLMQLGEPPLLYSSHKRASTEENLRQYLHTKGYFQAQVRSTVKFKGQKAYVFYKIQENKPSVLQEIRLNAPDEAIRTILEPYLSQSLLQKGQIYDQDVLAAERDRIYDLLLNKGYWGFSKQYIWFNVDNTSPDQTVAVETVVSLPAEGTAHSVYQLDQVDFKINPEPGEQAGEDSITYEGIAFKNIKQHFSPRVLIHKIPLRPGQLYSKQEIVDMQRRLINLNIFKTIHVSHDPLDQQHLITHIHTSLRDKFQFEHEIGTEFTRNSSIPFYQLSLKSRNLFRQLDILTVRSQFSVELGSIPTDGSNFYSVQNFHTAIGLQVPQLWLPLPTSKRTSLERYQSITKIDVGYTFANQPNYTSRHVKTILAYIWQPWRNVTLELTPLGIGLMDFQVKPDFEKELQERKDQGDLSYKRYKPALHTSLTLKSTFKNREEPKYENKKNYSWLELLLESGGTLQNWIDVQRLLGSRLTYYKYLKGSLSYSQHVPLQPGSIFAYHISAGILYPYNMDQVAPLDKYYFMGGPSSIRAWNSRSLGPGSYHADSTEEKKYFDERPGELMLQANIELRQCLYGVLEGAIFVDIGNVWMLNKSKRAGEDFAWNRFYQEIAVGTGVGLRLNFSVLVLRLDVGIKVYDPTCPVGARFFPKDPKKNEVTPTINFGLGYPF